MTLIGRLSTSKGFLLAGLCLGQVVLLFFLLPLQSVLASKIPPHQPPTTAAVPTLVLAAFGTHSPSGNAHDIPNRNRNKRVGGPGMCQGACSGLTMNILTGGRIALDKHLPQLAMLFIYTFSFGTQTNDDDDDGDDNTRPMLVSERGRIQATRAICPSLTPLLI